MEIEFANIEWYLQMNEGIKLVQNNNLRQIMNRLSRSEFAEFESNFKKWVIENNPQMFYQFDYSTSDLKFLYQSTYYIPYSKDLEYNESHEGKRFEHLDSWVVKKWGQMALKIGEAVFVDLKDGVYKMLKNGESFSVFIPLNDNYIVPKNCIVRDVIVKGGYAIILQEDTPKEVLIAGSEKKSLYFTV